VKALLDSKIDIWTNHAVPANDGGISLGQAAIATFADEVDDASTLSAVTSHA
jgi:hydrogenase maturation protein HypF